MPVMLLFYKENSFSNTELIALHAIFCIVVSVMEIPSGYISDRLGRKHSLLFGSLLTFIGFLIYSLTHTLILFVLAEIFLGIGHSFISGTDSAMLYDTLLENKRHPLYTKYEGRLTAIANFAEALAGLTVSFLGFIVMRNYFHLQAIIAFLGFVFSFLLVEPKIHKHSPKKSIHDMLQIVRYALKENKILRYYLVFSSIIGLSSLTLAWFSQIIFYSVDLPQKYYGYAWTILNLAVGLGSLSAATIENRMRRKASILYLAITLSLGFALLGIFRSVGVLIVLLVLFYIRGTAHPILKKYINEHTESHQRATILSIRSLIIRLLFSTIGPLVAFFSDRISVSFALLLFTFPLVLVSLLFAILLLKEIKTVDA